MGERGYKDLFFLIGIVISRRMRRLVWEPRKASLEVGLDTVIVG